MKLVSLVAALMFAVLAPNAYAADKGGIPPSLIPTFDESPGPMAVWTGFYIEGGFGMAISELDIGAVGGGTLATLGDSAWAGHIGVGYDQVVSPGFLLGVLGRIELDDVGYSLGGTSLAETEVSYVVGARAGWIPREDAMIYLLLGYKFSDLDLSGAVGGGDVSRDGFVFGGGIELMLTDHVGLGLEYTQTWIDDETVGGAVALEETDHAAKVRALYKF